MAQAVADDEIDARRCLARRPAVTAQGFSRHRQADGADIEGRHGDRSGPQARHHDGAASAQGIDVEVRRQALDGAQTGAGAAGRGIAVCHAALDVHARTVVQGCQFQPGGRARAQGAQDQRAAAGMLDQVAGQFGRDDADAPGRCLVKRHVPGGKGRLAPGVADVVHFADRDSQGLAAQVHFHRAIMTRVPWPGADMISNSLLRRLAPLSPNPIPEPEVQPSVMAWSMSGMPGP